MPRNEEVLSIFLASPGDLSDERARVAEVVADWNRAWSRHLGVRLELLRWEDDAYPDIGDDAQDVINRQIPSDWDMFIGIMWARFGSPTGRAGSGTREEYDRAMLRYRETADISLLFYFKDASIPPSKIDTTQLKLVQDFKMFIQSTGLLTWDFSDINHFGKLIELHITKHVQELRKAKTSQPLPSDIPPASKLPAKVESESVSLTTSQEFDDDAGYLDLVEMFSEQSQQMELIANRLTIAQQELTEQTNKGKKELDRLNGDASNVSVKTVRKTIAVVADEMLRFTARVEAEVPLFRAAVDATMNSIIRLASLSAQMYPERVNEIKTGVFGLLQTLVSVRESMAGFRESTASLPRMSKELNLAKRKQVAALSALLAEFENGELLLSEGLTVISGLSKSLDG